MFGACPRAQADQRHQATARWESGRTDVRGLGRMGLHGRGWRATGVPTRALVLASAVGLAVGGLAAPAAHAAAGSAYHPQVESPNGIVASDSLQATAAGIDVLNHGGN